MPTQLPDRPSGLAQHDDELLKTRLREHTLALLQRAQPLCREHRARLPQPEIRFDLRGLAAGQVRWHGRGGAEIRYNLAIAREHRAGFLAQTVVHEVAHLLTYACHGRTAPHGREWQAMMRYLGVEHPERCHRYSVDEQTVRRQRRWIYHCSCSEHELSTTRHRRMQNGTGRYHCRRCQAPLRPGARDRD
jgi:SprT protein